MLTLKSKFKGSKIDKEDSFVFYMQKRIQHYIWKPYRENVNQLTVVTESDDENFLLEQNINYTFRKIGEEGIKHITWIWSKSDVNKVFKAEASIQCPLSENCNQDTCNKEKSKNRVCNNGLIKIDKNIMDEKYDINKVDKENVGYKIPLSDFVPDVDNLRIALTIKCNFSKKKIYGWDMADPSKDVEMTIIYPKEYIIDKHIGGVEPTEYMEDEGKGVYQFSLKGWILPRTGVAVIFVKKSNSGLPSGKQDTDTDNEISIDKEGGKIGQL